MISIFAKQAFLNVNPHSPYVHRGEKPKRGYLMRVSSLIRGDQIADQIGAKYNPESGYENDVCIYVKPYVRPGNDFKFEGRQAYIDIIDGHNLGQLALKHPDVGIIVCSEADLSVMSRVIPNKIVCIPQHHCNYNRERRTRTKVKTMGVIGTRDAFPLLPKELKGELAKRGMELVEFSQFFTRQDIIDFYLKVDVQIVWRPYKKLLSNPLKLVNAASFGVPTIALDEVAFKELDNAYMPVRNLKELLLNLDALRSIPSLYTTYAERCLKKAEDYHIDRIGELYKRLDK